MSAGVAHAAEAGVDLRLTCSRSLTVGSTQRNTGAQSGGRAARRGAYIGAVFAPVHFPSEAVLD